MDTAASNAAEHLISAIQQLSLAQNLDTIAAIVRKTARELTGADGATFVLRDGALCHYFDEDAIGPLWKGKRFPMEICISGWVMLNRQAAVIEDIYSDDRIPADAYRPTFVRSLVMVPIRTLDPIGAIGNYWARTYHASEDDVRYLQALADATAVAMERVQLYQELEQRVSERTSELEATNQRLAREIEERHEMEQTLQSRDLEARQMRLQRDQLAGVLASAIAHEINQPMGAAISYVDAAIMLLRDEEPDVDSIIRAMEEAKTQNWRAVSIVRSFREMLRRGEPDIQPSDLSQVVHSATRQLEGEADKLGYAIGIDLSNDLGKVQCDCLQIEHVMLNLMRNGLEAMQEHEVTRGSLRVRVRPGRDGYAQISIADDGPGLSSETHNRLFAPFHTTKDDGLGLGLYTCHSIVKSHGGELWTDSNRRGGATFYFTLPMI